jgi:hypothetical protein
MIYDIRFTGRASSVAQVGDPLVANLLLVRWILGAWCLGFLWSLELGVWSFHLPVARKS